MAGSLENKRQTHISFGLGVRLAHEDWYIEEAFGGIISKAAFRSLCKALRVPMLHIMSERYVDVHRFELALTTILRIGQKDFLVPGCDEIKWGRSKKRATYLDQGYFRRHWRSIVEELMIAKQTNGAKLSRNVRDNAKAAAKMLAGIGWHMGPKESQDQRAANYRFNPQAVKPEFDDAQEEA